MLLLQILPKGMNFQKLMKTELKKKSERKKCREVSKVNKAPEKKRDEKVLKTPEGISDSDSDTQISIHDEGNMTQLEQDLIRVKEIITNLVKTVLFV
ncbi:hypothetical protein JTB14_005365 [Gonioctena quinquepunctata]|nr:hypothetical protein JTB14_005365 [Gonioctena quinquepunctata]